MDQALAGALGQVARNEAEGNAILEALEQANMTKAQMLVELRAHKGQPEKLIEKLRQKGPVEQAVRDASVGTGADRSAERREPALQEGTVKKGGQNDPPATPRPEPPAGQGQAPSGRRSRFNIS